MILPQHQGTVEELLSKKSTPNQIRNFLVTQAEGVAKERGMDDDGRLEVLGNLPNIATLQRKADLHRK